MSGQRYAYAVQARQEFRAPGQKPRSFIQTHIVLAYSPEKAVEEVEALLRKVELGPFEVFKKPARIAEAGQTTDGLHTRGNVAHFPGDASFATRSVPAPNDAVISDALWESLRKPLFPLNWKTFYPYTQPVAKLAGPRYVLQPGYITSDDQQHFISAQELRSLYGLTKNDNVVVDDGLSFLFHTTATDIRLAPRSDGRYYDVHSTRLNWQRVQVEVVSTPGARWTYLAPISTKVGDSVIVPFGANNRQVVGKVVRIGSSYLGSKIKDIIGTVTPAA